MTLFEAAKTVDLTPVSVETAIEGVAKFVGFDVDMDSTNALQQEVLKRAKKRLDKPKRMCQVVLDGNAWNPLRGFPRNHSCFCGSQKKFKKCCEATIARFVSKASADAIVSRWNEVLEHGIAIFKDNPEETSDAILRDGDRSDERGGRRRQSDHREP